MAWNHARFLRFVSKNEMTLFGHDKMIGLEAKLQLLLPEYSKKFLSIGLLQERNPASHKQQGSIIDQNSSCGWLPDKI